MKPEKKPEVKPEVEPSKPQEVAPSPEVKVEVEPEVKPEVKPEEVEVKKDKEQISNLNIALKQERERGKQSDEKVAGLEIQVKEFSETNERLKQAFTPKEEEEMEDETKYMTKDEADNYFEQKFEERQKKDDDTKKQEVIKGEISELEKEYSGEEGKLKYDDQEVLSWQKDNNKLYLSPREAFDSMKQSEIIDYAVKQRLAGKTEVENVEKPGAIDEIHQPEEFIPTNDSETRKAVEEAMDLLEKEI